MKWKWVWMGWVQMGEIAAWCLNENPVGRPEMREIVALLSQLVTSAVEWEASLGGSSQVFSGLFTGRWSTVQTQIPYIPFLLFFYPFLFPSSFVMFCETKERLIVTKFIEFIFPNLLTASSEEARVVLRTNEGNKVNWHKT